MRVTHAFGPSTWEAEAGLISEFQDSQGYTEKLCLKKTKQAKTKQNKTKQLVLREKLDKGPGVVMHTFNLPLGRQRQVNFWARGQPGLQSEFQDSQSYTEKSCLEKQHTPVTPTAWEAEREGLPKYMSLKTTDRLLGRVSHFLCFVFSRHGFSV